MKKSYVVEFITKGGDQKIVGTGYNRIWIWKSPRVAIIKLMKEADERDVLITNFRKV